MALLLRNAFGVVVIACVGALLVATLRWASDPVTNVVVASASWFLLVGGLRSAVLQVLATTSVAAYLGLGGLGRYLFDGHAVQDYPTMLAGATLIAVLALVADAVLLTAQRLLTPRGVRLMQAARS